MYGEYLKFCGFRVAEAQNGVEAIDKASIASAKSAPPYSSVVPGRSGR